MTRRTWIVAGVSVVTGALLAGGVAAAVSSPPASNTQGTVCVTSAGAMRFVATSARCVRGEKRATVGWSAKGVWSATVTYPPGSVVRRPSGSYVALRVSRNKPPETSPSSWSLLAATSVGPPGPAGPVGATGPKGDQGPAGVVGPIIMTQPPAFTRFSTTTTPTLVLQVGHIFGATADNGIIILGLAAPASVGGVTYRLSEVQWCLTANTTNGGVVTTAVVYHDAPGAPSSPLATAVTDPTDRTSAGCYTLAVPALNARGYSLALALTGQTTNLTQAGIVLGSVRTTWTAAG